MWMRVDDGLHSHRKTRTVTKSHPTKSRDAAPMGVWILAGSWAAQNGTDGWVPEDELDRFDSEWKPLVDRLVRAGYWWPHQRNNEPGYGFNDWHDYNDPAGAASKAGTFGNHVRWHVNEGRIEPECEHCPTEPEEVVEPSEDRGAIGGRSGGESHPDPGAIAGAIALPLPDPNPTRPLPTQETSAPPPPRLDVERLCEHLAERVAEDGSKRPTIGKAWQDAARLMLDRDGRTEAEVHAAIDWCQDHAFWRSNVLSMPKLREKYDQLRKQAVAEQQGKPRGGSRADEWQAMQERQMARAIEREKEMGLR